MSAVRTSLRWRRPRMASACCVMALSLLACAPAAAPAQGRCDTPEGRANEARARAAGRYAFPELAGRVVDDAGLLGRRGNGSPARVVVAGRAGGLLNAAEQSTLDGRLRALEAATGHQLVVVTVSSLGGHRIEDYGLMLGNHWGIGRKDYNDGVLLIVAPKEREVRIEVGCGLETALTDDEAAAILQQAVLPAFRERDYARGISAGVDRIIAEIGPQS